MIVSRRRGSWSAYDPSVMTRAVQNLLRTILSVARDLASLMSLTMRSGVQLAAEHPLPAKAAGAVHRTAREASPRRRRDADHPGRSVAHPRMASSAQRRQTEAAHPLVRKGIPVVVAFEIARAWPPTDSSRPAATHRHNGGREPDVEARIDSRRAPRQAWYSRVAADRATVHAAATAAREKGTPHGAPSCGTTRSFLASDVFVVVTVRFRVIYLFVILKVGIRRILHERDGASTAEWTARQFRMIVPGDQMPRFVIHDRYILRLRSRRSHAGSDGSDSAQHAGSRATGRHRLRTADRHNSSRLSDLYDSDESAPSSRDSSGVAPSLLRWAPV